MIFFLDTEFSRLPTPFDWNPDPCAHIKLLSAALVPLDPGAQVLYIEIDNPIDQHELGDFTRNEVIPIMRDNTYIDIASKIGRRPWGVDWDPQMSREAAAEQMSKYIAAMEGGILVCDFLLDWLLVKDLMKPSWPARLDREEGYLLLQSNLEPEALSIIRGIDGFFDRFEVPKHHALADAAALRFAWEDKIEKLIEIG
jgi:hypothetical protein